MASTTGLLSSGAKLAYATVPTGSETPSYTVLDNLQEVPDLGSVPNTVDVTCLADTNKRNIPGLVDYGSLEFGFLFDPSLFATLKGLEGTEYMWKFELPKANSTATAGTSFAFKAKPVVIMTGAAIDGALKFKLALTVSSNITFTAEA